MNVERPIQSRWWLLGGSAVLLLVLAVFWAVRPDAGKPAGKSARGPVKEKWVRETRTFGGPERQSVQPGRRPRKAGEMVATVESGGKHYELAPNRLGTFQRFYVKPEQAIPVTVNYPGGKPGEMVVVQMMDGGQLDGAVTAKGVALDANGRLVFTAQMSAEAGVHRVCIRRGGDEKVLDFWVGPDFQFQRPMEVEQRRAER